jgi:hypothetical protein
MFVRLVVLAVAMIATLTAAASAQELGADTICRPSDSDSVLINFSKDEADQMSVLVKDTDPMTLELTRLYIEAQRVDKLQQLQTGQLTKLDRKAILNSYTKQIGTYKSVVKTVNPGPFSPLPCADGSSPVAINVEQGDDCKKSPSSCHPKMTHPCNFGQRPYSACKKDGSGCQIWFEPEPVCAQ